MGCGSSIPSDHELEMRKVVMTAAKTNDMQLMRKAIDDINRMYNDPAKTKSACTMWDHEEGAERMMGPLKWAAENGNVEMCKLLLECGANVHSALYANKLYNGRFESPGGITALGRAAAAGQMDTVICLLDAGADPDYRDVLDRSAADLAGMEGHMQVRKFLKCSMKSEVQVRFLPTSLDGKLVLIKEDSNTYRTNRTSQQTRGLRYRLSKDVNDKDPRYNGYAAWGVKVIGHDDGDGWVKVELAKKIPCGFAIGDRVVSEIDYERPKSNCKVQKGDVGVIREPCLTDGAVFIDFPNFKKCGLYAETFCIYRFPNFKKCGLDRL